MNFRGGQSASNNVHAVSVYGPVIELLTLLKYLLCLTIKFLVELDLHRIVELRGRRDCRQIGMVKMQQRSTVRKVALGEHQTN